MRSCLYEGTVRHRRFAPTSHEFAYPLFMVHLDLDELPRLFDGRWLWSARGFNVAWFRRGDHFGPAGEPLADTVRGLIRERLGRTAPDGPIGLLTHLRYFGYVFNPVSFFYLQDETTGQPRHILAEVSNTPWNEHHCYVLDWDSAPGTDHWRHFEFSKEFHVSPFFPMNQEYEWRFTAPGDHLGVHMENYEEGRKVFDATMLLRRRPMTSKEMARCLLRYPMMTLQVIGRIYYQALRLSLKRCPFHSHPKHASDPREPAR